MKLVHQLAYLGPRGRRRKMPRQVHPSGIAREYAATLLHVVALVRKILHPLLVQLPSLLAGSDQERRTDADEGKRLRALLAEASAVLQRTLRPTDLEDIARKVAQQTSAFQAVQLGRQLRAALGVQAFPGERGVPAVIDSFVDANVALIKDLPQQVLDQIGRMSLQAVQLGTRHETLAQDIEQRFEVGESRAKLIARDQVGKLYGQLNAQRQQASGITRFIWRTSEDERVRPEHVILDGQEFSYDDPPAEGLPGEPVNCRCFAEPNIDSALDDDT